VETALSVPSSRNVRVFQDLASLSRAAAERFLDVIRECIPARGRFAVALSGGSTPKTFYSLLASDTYRKEVDWTKMHVFWADERCVPPEDRESNYRLVFETLLSALPVPVENIHRVRGEASPDEAARLYDEDLRAFFRGGQVPVFDLAVLGAGVDGHTASLFPGSDALRERSRFALPVRPAAGRAARVTLTLPVLNNAAHVLVLVSGPSKAGVIQEIFEAGNAKQLPAGFLRPVNGTLEWFLDRDAASMIRSGAFSRP
jgi:6-phosphogluconolactonase